MRVVWVAGIGSAAVALGLSLGGQVASAGADTGGATAGSGALGPGPAATRSRPAGPANAARAVVRPSAATTVPATFRRPAGAAARQAAGDTPIPRASEQRQRLRDSLPTMRAELGRSFNDLRDLTQRVLPAPVADVVNGGLFLVRRAVLPTGADVGLFGGAACVKSLDCSGKDLTGAQLDGRTLTGVNWGGATLEYANLRDSYFGPPELRPGPRSAGSVTTPSCYPNCEGANLSGVDLKRADLQGANFTSANLTYANMYEADLTGANLTDANLYGADLVTAILNNATATGANFTYADMHEMTATGVILTGATLFGSMIGSNLTSANLTGANAGSSDMTGVNLSYANLTGANFKVVNLSGADLYGANLTDTNLYQAALIGAILTGVTWSNTTCPDGTVSSTVCSV